MPGKGTETFKQRLTDQCVAVFVQHFLVLALSGLAHECVVDGPGEGGGVAAVVLETFGNVDSFNLLGSLKLAHVQNELMGIETCRTNREVQWNP